MRSWVGIGLCAPALIALYAPLGTVLLRGLSSIEGWVALFANSALFVSLFHSVGLAVLVCVGTLFFALCGAWGFSIAPPRVRTRVEMLCSWVIVLPEIVQGICLLVWFGLAHLTLGWITLWVAHLAFCLPFAAFNLMRAIGEFPPEEREAALDLGASEGQVFWRVTLPRLIPSLAVSAVLVFALSLDDFLISFFTSGPEQDLLPPRIYSLVRFGIHPELAALSVLLLGVTTAGVLLVLWIKNSVSAGTALSKKT